MMEFPLSGLLLVGLYVSSSLSVSSGIPVLTQTPHVSAMKGENVNITCCWRGEFERGTFEWWKNQIRIKSELVDFNVAHESPQKVTSGCSYLILSSVTKTDSGRYTCQLSVEIPLTTERVNGSGTVLTVTVKENTRDHSDDRGHKITDAPESDSEIVWIHLLRCLPLLALIVSFFCLNHWGTKTLLHKPGVDGNTIPSDQGIEEEGGEEEGEEGGEEGGDEAEGCEMET